MTDTKDHAQQPPPESSPQLSHVARQPSWTGSMAESPTDQSPIHSRKRSADHLPAEPHVSRKGRACLACRKLKVKCDSLERGDAGCSRCQRLGLDCITSKRMRVSLDDDGENPHPSIVRLDRAVEDILSRLKMPALESYSRTHPSQHLQPPPPALAVPVPADSNAQTTRENSREPMNQEDAHEVAPAPMGSLFEVTQLNTLRSRLKYGDPARRNSKKNMENDLVSMGIISVEEAEEMFELFKRSLSRYLFDATVHESRSLLSVRESSTLFFTAIITVTSLHIPGKEKIHATAHKQLRDLIAASFFDRFHTLEDLRALCIAAFWLPDLSWKLSGHCVRIATELNLHQAFFKALYSQKQSPSEREHAFERARLWYLLYVLDHHFSIAYGRPPVTAELQAIKEYDVFLNAPECTPSDRRVLSQVTLFIILSKAYNHFGLEAERLMDGDDVTLLTHQRFIEDLDRWRYQFRHALNRDAHVGDYPAVGVELHYYFASMMLNSLALRGRSLFTISSTSTLPSALRPLASHAISSAHQILTIVLEEPFIRDSMVGVPLYLHTVIAFAVVFLIKMSSRWTGIGVTIDAETKTKPLIEGVIALFRSCRAGRGHILYAMADGFERLLKRNMGRPGENGVGAGAGAGYGSLDATAAGLRQNGGRDTPYSAQHPGHAQTAGRDYSRPPEIYASSSQTNTPNLLHPQQTTASPTGFTPTGSGAQQQQPPNGAGFDPYALSPHSQPTSAGTFGGWQTEDDMLWSMGMGYDLLATAPDVNAHGLGAFVGWPGGSIESGGGGYSQL
ncbi:Transcriptional activator of protease prtT [Cladophialophora carrionii]|uniref:Transcriptional activator of protease prtT n=1 Tax=Cladophialophora carrionii TaxID=86049 RepID=A0A1C1CSC5_9EURO|nr:Transcriptional activator of protease prtT [Cladophialophora carrionii]